MARLSSQPIFSIAQAKATLDTDATDSGLISPHSTNATITEPVTAKMVLSMPKLRCLSSIPTPDSSPGWMSPGYRPSANVLRSDRRSCTKEESCGDASFGLSGSSLFISLSSRSVGALAAQECFRVEARFQQARRRQAMTYGYLQADTMSVSCCSAEQEPSVFSCV